jgi:23S rRNA (guanosine2251-2'-O)-methyltransferase
MNHAYWIFGKNAVKAALANSNREIIEVRLTKQAAELFDISGKIKQREVTIHELDELLPGSVHQGIAIKVMPLDKPHIEWLLKSELNRSIVLILDQLTDPHNVGAIIRTAAAFSVSAIVTTNRHTVRETSVVAKSAAGALELVPIIEVANLAESIKLMKKHNYWIFGLNGEARDEVSILADYEKIGIVLGSEGNGIRDLVAKSCDMQLRIPTSNQMGCLNVSNACAIALYAAQKIVLK